jgi:diacylglycerol kinase (ATP)
MSARAPTGDSQQAPPAARRSGSHRVRSATPPVLLIANANASGLAGRRGVVESALALLRGFGARAEARLTSSVEELAAVVSSEERRLVLLGGDGSVHAVANIPGPKPEIALLPAGKANNLARGLGIPIERKAAARLAATGAPRRIDLIAAQTTETRYLAVEGVSLGYQAYARARYHGVNSGDLAAGVTAGLRALTRFHSIAAAVQIDDTLEVLKLSQLFVVNFPLYGPGLCVAPAADPADGLLDLVNVDTTGRMPLLRMLARIRQGTHVDLPGVRHWRARRIRFATGGLAPIIADTTNLGFGAVELTVEPGALAVIAPAS